MAEIKSFPNNADEYISAEWPMRWLHGRTSGVFGENGGGAVTAVLDTMKVTVDDATGWLSNDNSDGICWFNDTYKSTGKKLELEIGAADGVLSRIDRVVVEWKTTTYADKPEIKILQGTASSNPTPPALTNDNLKRQISLASVLVPAGSTSVSSANITDERLNPSVCGIVTDRVDVDTSMVNTQIEALISELQYDLEQVLVGSIPAHHITHAAGGTDEITPDSIKAAALDANNKVAAAQTSAWIVSVTASKTLELADAGTSQYCTNSSDITITVPANASVDFPIGTEIEIVKGETGGVSIAASSGVTINGAGTTLDMGGQYSIVCLKQFAVDTWIVAGGLA